jgi:L-amino acid N-acyltransferase YncA
VEFIGHGLDDLEDSSTDLYLARIPAWLHGAGANEKSIRLHERLGFVELARMPQVSAKFGEWLDLVFLELLLDDRNAPGEE